jgi:hypothetical protein
MSKLYATATSEKASKGQGGNKYINVDITTEDGRKILKISVYPDTAERPENGMAVITLPSGKVIRHLFEMKQIGKSECSNGGIHIWHKPYTNEDIHKCSMCDKVKGETKGKSQKGDI